MYPIIHLFTTQSQHPVEVTLHQHHLCCFSLPKEQLYANSKVGERFSYMDGEKSPAEFPHTPTLSCEHLPANRGVISLLRMEFTSSISTVLTNIYNEAINVWLQI